MIYLPQGTEKPLHSTVSCNKASILRNAIPNWNFRTVGAFQLLTNIPSLHHISWSLKCESPPDKTVWQDEVYNSVHLDSLWRLCLLLLGHVIVPARVKATAFSHLLPFRGGDAERRVHLIIGLSAFVFMLDFRFCPAHTLETPDVCVCVQGWSADWSMAGPYNWMPRSTLTWFICGRGTAHHTKRYLNSRVMFKILTNKSQVKSSKLYLYSTKSQISLKELYYPYSLRRPLASDLQFR